MMNVFIELHTVEKDLLLVRPENIIAIVEDKFHTYDSGGWKIANPCTKVVLTNDKAYQVSETLDQVRVSIGKEMLKRL